MPTFLEVTSYPPLFFCLKNYDILQKEKNEVYHTSQPLKTELANDILSTQIFEEKNLFIWFLGTSDARGN